MADEDEDLSHLRTMNLDPAADEDGEEETLDYGAAFAKLAYGDLFSLAGPCYFSSAIPSCF